MLAEAEPVRCCRSRCVGLAALRDGATAAVRASRFEGYARLEQLGRVGPGQRITAVRHSRVDGGDAAAGTAV